MRVRSSIHIAAPVGVVFDFVKDPTNWVGLFTGVEVNRRQEGAGTTFAGTLKVLGIPLPGKGVYEDLSITPEGLGTRFRMTLRILAVPVSLNGVFTEFEPNRRIVVQESREVARFWFEPESGGTQITIESDHPIANPFIDRMLERLFARPMQRSLERVLGRLKAKLVA